ncbi:hypothetical protein [Alkaliphilus oremlandii]|uniref:Uncharacterized protein n=1 Tax=Alkaliphilus oremlandii (strain OhILAs) TaxID=350688 RepID=A8MI26_ALKOO|nr:hypothetical protein [Alkaliphilus oremlandii]ABW19458.1 hypothetical protein Clos_1918 [Alkaliphilus oremlandii OhILAs]
MKSNFLLWNEDMDRVYGKVSDFENQGDFINTVKQYCKDVEEGDCIVENIEIDTCVSTCNGIEAETLIKIKDTDIEIATYYMADVCIDD